MKIFTCDCGLEFDLEVWHCQNDDHHWPMARTYCANCHEHKDSHKPGKERSEKKEPTLNGIPVSQLRAAPRKVWEAQQRRERIKRLDARLEEHREIFENRKLWVGPYEFYLQSDDWKATRTMKLLSVDFYCEECKESLVVPACRSIHPLFFKDSADIHHLHYRTIGKEALEDLQALCRHCHHSIHVNRGW